MIGTDAALIRVDLPAPLRRMCGAGAEVQVAVRAGTLRGVLDALETAYPMLRGTIRDQVTGERRAFMRFFAEERDWSHAGMDEGLPESVLSGREALLVVGAIAGG